MSIIDPKDFIALKAAVKAEMLRRKYENSLVTFGGSGYDYTNAPAVDDGIYEEHYTKNIVPLMAANSKVVPDADMPREISKDDLDSMTALVEIMSARTNLADRTSTDCNGNCAGACYTACSTGCYTTCSGGCSSGCSGSCGLVCSFACGYDSNCGATCSGECVGQCLGGCYTVCAITCGGNCSSDCVETCSGTCVGTCVNACGGVSEEEGPWGGDVEEGTPDTEL